MSGPLWIDERGRRCPIPVISLARAHARWLAEGTAMDAEVGVLADDPAAEHDIPAWCRLKGVRYEGSVPPADGGPGAGYLVRFTAAGQQG